jgi:alpha-L-rhamnosidase
MTSRFDGDAKEPVRWIGCPDARQAPLVTAYRLRIALNAAVRIRIHLSADQRYVLYVDGERCARGPERGDRYHWFYDSRELELAAGTHVLVAHVWSLPLETMDAPKAQVSVWPGFVLTADAPHRNLVATGVAPWEAMRLDGYSFLRLTSQGPFIGFTGSRVDVDGTCFPWGFEQGAGEGWVTAERLQVARDSLSGRCWGDLDRCRLQPGTLPPMVDGSLRSPRALRHLDAPADLDTRTTAVAAAHHLADEAPAWVQFLERGAASGAGISIPPHTTRRAIIDLQNYYCAYPELTLSGGLGAEVRLGWAESLFESLGFFGVKGNRDAVEGKSFCGVWDRFRPDGEARRTFRALWWNCGRYLELIVRTGDQPLTLERLDLLETRYPFEREGRLALSEPRFAAADAMMWRSLQMCAHETYMDCPYHEQLQYVGDTRLQVLVTYVSTRDDRLPRKAIAMLQASQLANGLLQSRYPANGGQIIPQFSLYWVGMVHDFARWRGDRAFVRSMMPGVRAVMEAFIAQIDEVGLMRTPEGWDYVDWVPAWQQGSGGQATLDASGLSAFNHLLFIAMAGLAAELELWMDEPALAARLTTVRTRLMEQTRATFWDAGRQLFADTPSRDTFSEHTLSMACLTGLLTEPERAALREGLLHAPDLARATVYMQHYLFEAYYALGCADAILARLDFWYGLTATGLKTTIEQPEPSRSDCHAWGAHPIYHAYASLLGIRPDGWGARRLRVAPGVTTLASMEGTWPHPAGDVSVHVRNQDGAAEVTVTAPAGVEWVVVAPGTRQFQV